MESLFYCNSKSPVIMKMKMEARGLDIRHWLHLSAEINAEENMLFHLNLALYHWLQIGKEKEYASLYEDDPNDRFREIAGW